LAPFRKRLGVSHTEAERKVLLKLLADEEKMELRKRGFHVRDIAFRRIVDDDNTFGDEGRDDGKS
jgi:hypothetical protein